MVIRGVGPTGVAQLALAAVIFASLAACGGSGGSPGSSSAVSAAASVSAVSSAAGSSNSVTSTSPASSSSSAPPPVPTNKSQQSVTLSWSPPIQNSDGSAVTNLAGYTLHYGTTSQDYTGTITITNPAQTSYIVSASNFPAGTYYFAISAYNAQQDTSSLSGEVTVTID